MKKVLVVFADGFEEIEALAPVDILRRSGCEVITASLNEDMSALSSRKVRIIADSFIDSQLGTVFDAVVFPGGMPGALNISKNRTAELIARNTEKNGGIIAAICASPAVVLSSWGLLRNRKAVCYPGMETEDSTVEWKDGKVINDHGIITARGAGCAIDFALELVRALVSDEVTETLINQIVY